MNPTSIDWNNLGITQAGTNQPKQKKELGQQDFMKLLLTQLQSQDPLKPQENGEFISQMAQFSQLDGISKLNSSFEQVASQIRSTQALQASAMVGHSVQVDANQVVLHNNDKNISGSVVLPDTGQNVTVAIKNAAGQVVKRIELGSYSAGAVPFEWDGTDSEGNRVSQGKYEIVAEGMFGNQNARVPTWVGFNVDSVSLGGGKVLLNLADHGTVNVSDIRQIS